MKIVSNFDIKKALKDVQKLRLRGFVKAELVLVLLGAKPAADLDIRFKDSDPKQILLLLKKYGLKAVSVKPKDAVRDQLKVQVILAVSKKISLVKTLAKLLAKDVLNKNDHKIFGKLMGFPETAIKAFVNRLVLSDDKRPKMRGIPLEFAMSRDHWADEFLVMKNWANLLKKNTPTIYRQALKNK